jgi:hypothetical protein
MKTKDKDKKPVAQTAGFAVCGFCARKATFRGEQTRSQGAVREGRGPQTRWSALRLLKIRRNKARMSMKTKDKDKKPVAQTAGFAVCGFCARKATFRGGQTRPRCAVREGRGPQIRWSALRLLKIRGNKARMSMKTKDKDKKPVAQTAGFAVCGFCARKATFRGGQTRSRCAVREGRGPQTRWSALRLLTWLRSGQYRQGRRLSIAPGSPGICCVPSPCRQRGRRHAPRRITASGPAT